MNKVVVPKFVDDFFCGHWEDALPNDWDKADLIRNQEQYIRDYASKEFKDWIVNAKNFILFTKAIMNGYEVEREPNELDHLIAIYNNCDKDFELTVRRYIVQKDFTNELLISFLYHIDWDDENDE